MASGKVTSATIFMLFTILIAMPLGQAASVTRIVSPLEVEPGKNVEVRLRVDVSGGSNYYAIDEEYPEGWEVVDAGAGSTEHRGHWKHVVIEAGTNTDFSYVMRAPQEEGEYAFSGVYQFGGMQTNATILGDSSVSVRNYVQPTPADYATNYTLIIVVMALIVLAIYLSRRKKSK